MRLAALTRPLLKVDRFLLLLIGMVTLATVLIGSGLLLLCLMPSTVQSSIALTAIARGDVPAAVCSASASILIGVFLTPILAGLLRWRAVPF